MTNLRNAGTLRQASSATFARIDAATSSTVILAAATRVGASIFNDSTDTLHLLCADTGDATTTNRSVELGPGDLYELPYGFAGRVVGIWTGTNGGANVTTYS